jgi:hypothetical protein
MTTCDTLCLSIRSRALRRQRMLLNSSVGLGERGSIIRHIGFRFGLGVLEDEAVYTFFTVSRTEEAGQTLISQDFRDRYRARI